jgi:peptide/nickel transport system permease protein
MNSLAGKPRGGTAAANEPAGARRINLAGVYRWTKRLPLLPVALLAPLLVFGVFGPLIYPHEPHLLDLSRTCQPPAWVSGGEWSFPLGTDQLGRDLLSRLIEGARSSLLVGFFGALLSTFLGMVIGMAAGYFGGRTDQVVMRVVDTWMAIPGVFFTLMFVAAVRHAGVQGLGPIIVAISLTMWPQPARMVRAEVLTIKQLDYVALAKVTGASDARIMAKHLFPNVLNITVVMTSLGLGGAIMMESGLSFLGVGVQPPSTAWGSLISGSIAYMSSTWWIPTFAGIAITITILGANLFGDWVRDALDPRTRQSMR